MKRTTSFLFVAAILAISIIGVNANVVADTETAERSAKRITTLPSLENILILRLDEPSGADEALAKQVAKKIRSLTNYSVFDYITYTVSDGAVTLNGKIASLGTKAEAERVIKKISGVTGVVNNLENLPPSSSDDQIRWQMVRTFSDKGFYRYVAMPNPEVHIIVEMGRVTLEGRVANKSHADALNVFANTIPGTFRVTNNIIVGDTAAE